MAPLCPIDGIPLIPFVEDANTAYGNFWECTLHKGRYLSHGLAGLIPVPKAVVSKPPDGYQPVLNLYYDPASGNLNYLLQSGGGSNPVGGDLKYLELNAAGQAAGNLNLTDANWDESKVQIDYIKVTVTAGVVTDFDIAVFEKDTFLAADKRYEAKGLNSVDNWEDDIEWSYTDDNAMKEVHLKITENAGGPGTYDIQFRGVKLV